MGNHQSENAGLPGRRPRRTVKPGRRRKLPRYCCVSRGRLLNRRDRTAAFVAGGRYLRIIVGTASAICKVEILVSSNDVPRRLADAGGRMREHATNYVSLCRRLDAHRKLPTGML